MSQQKIPADTIRTSRLEIVDSEGRPRIVLSIVDGMGRYGGKEAPSIQLFDHKGQQRLSLWLVDADGEDQFPSLDMQDEHGFQILAIDADERRPRIVVDESEVLDLRALYLSQQGRSPMDEVHRLHRKAREREVMHWTHLEELHDYREGRRPQKGETP